MHVSLIPAFSDNYIYAIVDNDNCWIVDPGEAAPVEQFLSENSLTLKGILLTHHHADHIGGLATLKAASGCQVVGPEDLKTAGVDRVVSEGDSVDDGPLHYQVLAVPGHTLDHLAFYFPKNHWVFTGDSLFAGGCGRLFEGSPAQMLESLSKLAALPDNTEVFCGHEYTLSNLRFALTVDPDNAKLQARLQRDEALRDQGKPTIPSTIGEEKATNPFLRSASPGIRQTLGMEQAGDSEVFAEVRSRKDNF